MTKKIKTISGLQTTLKLVTVITTFILIANMIRIPLNNRRKLILLNSDYQNKILSLKSTISDLEENKNNLEETKLSLLRDIEKYSEESKNYQNALNDNIDKVIDLKNKYSYALTYSEKFKNADFGIYELLYLNDICEDYNIPIELMLAIFEKESQFYSLAKNPTSTATGYGQLIDSTAKSMYEKYLKLGTYDIKNHRIICTDKELNILLSCRLIKYNIDSYGTYEKALERYYGHSDSSLNKQYAKSVFSKMRNYM